MYKILMLIRAHQIRWSGRLLRLGFNEIAQFLQYSYKRSSHIPEMWPIQVLMFNILFQTRGTCGSGERNVKIWIDFRKSPRFSLTSPLSQERERSQVALFLLCVVSPDADTSIVFSWPCIATDIFMWLLYCWIFSGFEFKFLPLSFCI